MKDKCYFVHESSYIDDDVEIGSDTKIWYFSHVQKGSRIGKNCSLGQNVNISPRIVFTDNGLFGAIALTIPDNVLTFQTITGQCL